VAQCSALLAAAMRVAHAINTSQVDTVLRQFDATTEAIRGIESKMKRMQAHAKTANEQRTAISKHAQECTDMMDSMSKTLIELSDDALEYFAVSVDRFAGLFETLEASVAEIGVLSAHKELQRELWPLLVPVMCLCIILTASNCVFGFRLAGDSQMAQFDLEMVIGMGSENPQEGDNVDSSVSLLSLFAIFHVVLIGCAVLYIIGEITRRMLLARKPRKVVRKQQAMIFDLPDDVPLGEGGEVPCSEDEGEDEDEDMENADRFADKSPYHSVGQVLSSPASPTAGEYASQSREVLEAEATPAENTTVASPESPPARQRPSFASQSQSQIGAEGAPNQTPASLYSSFINFLHLPSEAARGMRDVQSSAVSSAGTKDSPLSRAQTIEADNDKASRSRPSFRSEGGAFVGDETVHTRPDLNKSHTMESGMVTGMSRRRSKTEEDMLSPSRTEQSGGIKGMFTAAVSEHPDRPGPVSGVLRNLQKMTEQVVQDRKGRMGSPRSERDGRRNSTSSNSTFRDVRLKTGFPRSESDLMRVRNISHGSVNDDDSDEGEVFQA